jgi:hypothetical protein
MFQKRKRMPFLGTNKKRLFWQAINTRWAPAKSVVLEQAVVNALLHISVV